MKKVWIFAAATTAALAAIAALAHKKEQETEEVLEPSADMPEETAAPVVLEEGDDEDIYYWAEKGGVWHSIADCSYLARTPEIRSGTVEAAKRAGKHRACASCAR